MLDKFGRSEPGPNQPVTVCEVKSSDLPLFCPPEDAALWSMHPRVYLPIEQNGHQKCPYCGAEYRLSDD